MAEKSLIGWTNSTWSPLRARVKANAGLIAADKGYASLINIATTMAGRVGHHCEHASPECLNCYSEANNERCLPTNGTGLPFDRRSRDLIDPIVDEKILLQPLKWRKPRRIFVESQSDLFGEWYTDDMIDQVFAVMALCPEHRFQVLTKRADRMLKWFERGGPRKSVSQYDLAGCAVSANAARLLKDKGELPDEEFFEEPNKWADRFPWLDLSGPMMMWPLPHIDLGVSAGTQKAADERIPLLLQTPAAVRWVSIEPQLEAVNVAPYLKPPYPYDWIVIGGESGRGARPFRIEWAENLIAQCQAAGVPAFMKQLGSNPIWAGASCSPIEPSRGKNDDPSQWPESLRVQEYPA